MGGRFERKSGTYLIVFRFDADAFVDHPRFGRIALGPVGLYAGSGKGGSLGTRVQRHLLGQAAARHYHIDHVSPLAIERSAILREGRFDECALAQALCRLPSARPVLGFGSSDCRAGCPSHYVHIDEKDVGAARAIASTKDELMLGDYQSPS